MKSMLCCLRYQDCWGKRPLTFNGVFGLGQSRLKLHLGMLEVVDLGNRFSFVPKCGNSRDYLRKCTIYSLTVIFVYNNLCVANFLAGLVNSWTSAYSKVLDLTDINGEIY